MSLVIIFLICTQAYAERIVSLSPGITEILFAVGAGDSVVGVTDSCDYPPEISKLPKVGNVFRPSLERIVSLRPDIVFGSVEGAEKSIKENLKNVGIEGYFYTSKDAEDIIYSILNIAKILNLKEPELVKKMTSLFLEECGEKTDGVFLVGADPFSAAGGETFIDDIMSCAGVRNIISNRYRGYVLVSYEFLITEKPEYIFVSGSMGNTGTDRLIRRLKASGVKSKIIRLDCDCFLRPSYRIMQACKEMREIVSR